MAQLYPLNPNAGQRIQGATARVTPMDQAFLAQLAKTVRAAEGARCKSALALAGTTTTVTTFLNQPDVARNVTIVANAAGVAGNVVVTGVDLAGVTIVDTIALNGDTPVAGVLAFARVTQIVFPVETHVGTDTVDVGYGSALGLHHKLPHNTVLRAFLNNVVEGTAPTVTTSKTALGSNTVTLNSALSTSDVVDADYLV